MRQKKVFPAGTFLPTSQRLLAIIQLCISFSLVCWYAAQPFMGEYFSIRSRQLIYEYAMGTSDNLKKTPEQLPKLTRQAERFATLQPSEKKLILEDYQLLHNFSGRPFWKKIEGGLQVLFFDIPPFELAWLVFSIVISILLLLKKEGAKQAVWILPLIVLAYAIDNRLEGHSVKSSPDLALFPTEELILTDYVDQPLESGFGEQKEQLKKGWERYLVSTWLPVDSKALTWEQEVEESEFVFTIARLQRLHGQSSKDWLTSFHEKVNIFSLGLYMLWNLFFAWKMSRPTQFPIYTKKNI